MSAAPADLSISSRWILPMTGRDALLEHHTLLVRDGRILDVLPADMAAARYVSTVHVDRPGHLLLPGLVDARARIVPDAADAGGAEHIADVALLRVAAMLRAGTTCFCTPGHFPEESARIAAAQGLRAVIGIPLGEPASAAAAPAGDHLTRALNFRDEWGGHPSISTAFAPLEAAAIDDALFARIAMLADELDAGILMSLHESAAEVAASVTRHGLRPIARLQALGLLTPALTAANLVHVDAADMALAQRSGIALTLCPGSNLRAGFGPPPVALWAGTGLRLGVGTGATNPGTAADLWSESQLLALLGRARHDGHAADSGAAASGAPAASDFDAWDALAAATRGGAAALGLDDIGTLETGKWADLCCVDLCGPAMVRASAPDASRLVFQGGRDMVNDVWVAGRHLLNGGAFTRLDWAALARRVAPQPQPQPPNGA